MVIVDRSAPFLVMVSQISGISRAHPMASNLSMVEVQKADMEKPNAERDVLEQELRDVRRRSKNIMDAIETGSANPQLVARLDDLTQQKNTLTYQLSTMEAEKPLLFTKEQYLFLLQQFYAQPTEQDDAYKRRLINTFVTNIEVSDSELLIYFNISEETESKNKNAPQLNFDKSSSTEKRLVQQSWTNPNFFPPPNQRSKCPQNGRFGCHLCS